MRLERKIFVGERTVFCLNSILRALKMATNIDNYLIFKYKLDFVKFFLKWGNRLEIVNENLLRQIFANFMEFRQEFVIFAFR